MNLGSVVAIKNVSPRHSHGSFDSWTIHKCCRCTPDTHIFAASAAQDQPLEGQAPGHALSVSALRMWLGQDRLSGILPPEAILGTEWHPRLQIILCQQKLCNFHTRF